MKRWIGEAWDELEEILADEESEPEEKERQQHKKKNESYKTGELQKAICFLVGCLLK